MEDFTMSSKPVANFEVKSILENPKAGQIQKAIAAFLSTKIAGLDVKNPNLLMAVKMCKACSEFLNTVRGIDLERRGSITYGYLEKIWTLSEIVEFAKRVPTEHERLKGSRRDGCPQDVGYPQLE